ncbi:MAG TPA: hypothetical protein VFB21_00765 [Chthonomonadaceae bacterium]|nr:hypothetical protein [Chthonomonadaceae bacterium]
MTNAVETSIQAVSPVSIFGSAAAPCAAAIVWPPTSRASKHAAGNATRRAVGRAPIFAGNTSMMSHSSFEWAGSAPVRAGCPGWVARASPSGNGKGRTSAESQYNSLRHRQGTRGGARKTGRHNGLCAFRRTTVSASEFRHQAENGWQSEERAKHARAAANDGSATQEPRRSKQAEPDASDGAGQR